jgi:hypothetical protein
MDGIVETLCLQIQYLTEQNKLLMEQNIKLTEMLNGKKPEPTVVTNLKTKESFLDDELKQLILTDNSWELFLKQIDQHLIIEDPIKFLDKGYKQTIVDIITRIFKSLKHKPFHTLSKKSKIVALYRNKQWEKLSFDKFVYEVKILTNTIIHGCMCKFKNKIPKNVMNETLVVMCEDTDKYKEQIANSLIESCIIIL